MREKIILNMILKCKGCKNDISLLDIKKIGTKLYCSICYSNIITMLNGGNPFEVDDMKNDENSFQNPDDEDNKRPRSVFC